MPDGMAIDTHGGLWVALFGGSCIVRIDPSSGAKTHKVVVPTSNITPKSPSQADSATAMECKVRLSKHKNNSITR